MTTYRPDVDIYQHGLLVLPTAAPPGLTRVASTCMPIYSGYTLCIVDSNGTSLNERASRLLAPAGPHAVADYWDEGDVRYCILAMLYHMNRIVDRYVEKCQLFETNEHLRSAIRGNTDDPQLFYEIDALLSSARRVYGAILNVVWKYYGEGGLESRWAKIPAALKSDKIPTSFSHSLDVSWSTVGEKLKGYRDCIAHYYPLTNGQTTCWMDRIGDQWGMTVRLPSNPESKSRRKYDFNAGPDALTYCHGVACHLVGLAEDLAREPAIATRLSA